MTRRILLDTDIGGDIDDALCLSYLLTQPSADLLGITTIGPPARSRAMVASALCRAAGVAVPIYPGADRALPRSGGEPEQDSLIAELRLDDPAASVLRDVPHETSFPSGQAVEFLRHTIRDRPGEITLVTIGPLTNIALLFAIDPQIPALLHSMVSMFGAFARPACAHTHVEHNAGWDPTAAAMVLAADVPRLFLVGLDVTNRVSVDADTFRERCTGRMLELTLQFAEASFLRHFDRVVFHDPLAAATVFEDELCTFVPGQVMVDWQSPVLCGLTTCQPRSTDTRSRHFVAVDVKPETFFDHYFSVTATKPTRS